MQQQPAKFKTPTQLYESEVDPSCRISNTTQPVLDPAVAFSAFPRTAYTKTQPRLFHSPPPRCCWPRMLHLGWGSAAESPGPWSVGCSRVGQERRREGRRDAYPRRCTAVIVSVTG